MPPFELLLPLGALAFYVYDCVILLYDNELLLLNAGARWQAAAGSEQLLFRRRICLPGLLRPWLAIYRLCWRDSPLPAAASDATGRLLALPGALPLQWLCGAMLFLMLPVLPVVALGYGAGWALLGVFAAYYLLILAALAVVWRRRREWRLGGRSYATLALDALACAPFAVNLLQRISLQQRTAADGVDCARAVCDAPARQRLRAVLTARLDERIAAADADGVAAQSLRDRRRQLQELLGSQALV